MMPYYSLVVCFYLENIMKRVLITGGSRGLGAALVRTFVENGDKVAFTFNNSYEAAMRIAEETGAIAIRANSALESDILAAVYEAETALGGIDCLINNAGISSFSLFTDLTLDEWNYNLSVNLTGAFLYTREVLRGMISRKYGRIINISSVWGLVGSSCEVHYSTAKAALIGMTKALAKEVGPSGITVNAIAPGVIDTDMNNQLSQDDLLALEADTPMSRLGFGADVAKAALFLSSDEASFITGDVLNVSGGFVI